MASDKGKLVKLIVILALVFFVVILPAILLSNIFAVYEIFGYAVDSLNSIGLNRWFAKAIVIILIGPFIWGLKRVFSFRGKKRTIGWVVVSIYTAAFYVVMGFGTQGHITDKYLQLRADGIQYDIVDHGGINPYTNDSLVQMTESIMEVLGQYDPENDGTLDLSDALIHPITGEGLKYYVIDKNNLIVIYDIGGLDPYTGQERREITPEVALMFWDQSDRLEQQEEQERATLDSLDRVNTDMAREQAGAVRARRDVQDARVKYLVNANFAGFSDNDVGLFIATESKAILGGYSGTVETALRTQLGKTKTVAVFPFSDAFVAEGHLDGLINGNTGLLDRMKLDRRSGWLATLTVSPVVPTGTVAGMKTIEIPCQLIIVGINGVQAVNEQIIGKGTGKTDDQCLRQAAADIKRRIMALDL